MKTVTSLVTLLINCLLLWSCEKTEDNDSRSKGSEYLVLSSKPIYPDLEGIITRHAYSGSILEGAGAIETAKSPHPELFADGVLEGDFLYVIRPLTGLLEKISIEAGAVIATWDPSIKGSYDYVTGINRDKTLALTNTQLVVSYTKWQYKAGTEDQAPHTYLKFFNKNSLLPEDSLFLSFEAKILDFKHVGNKLYIGLAHSWLPDGQFIVVDATTKQKLADVQLPRACTQLLITDNNRLLALIGDDLAEIDIQNYVIKNLKKFNGYQTYDTSTPTIAIDNSSNTLYYFDLVAQPSPVPYALKSLDLNTLKEAYLTDLSIGIHPPIIFDDQHKVIVSTSRKSYNSSQLLIIDKEGKVLEEDSLLNYSQKILIR